MAATAMDLNSALELASGLEIPIKLRCASCNKLVVNAFKLPCCDQFICEPCQTSLVSSCPICAHSPLNPADCNPAKSLRVTVRAFLRTEEKKRENTQNAVNAPPSATPTASASLAETVNPETHTSQLQSSSHQTNENLTSPLQGHPLEAEEHPQAQAEGSGSNVEAAPLQPATDPTNANDEQKQNESAQNSEGNAPAMQKSSSSQGQQAPKDPVKEEEQSRRTDLQHGMGGGQSYGPGQVQGASQAGVNGMGWNSAAGFNPMMQMQMPNAMQNGNWTGVPDMMGYSNMNFGMDPMSMQQGMFGGDFGMGMNGMNMNGMNMNMNYGGYGGNWNGQQMSDSFGANAGYYPGGGFNQQSHQGQFAHQMHHPQYTKFQNDHFQGRGAYSHRGQGRGYFRNQQYDGHGQGHHFNNAPNQQWHNDRGAAPAKMPEGVQDRPLSQQEDRKFQRQEDAPAQADERKDVTSSEIPQATIGVETDHQMEDSQQEATQTEAGTTGGHPSAESGAAEDMNRSQQQNENPSSGNAGQSLERDTHGLHRISIHESTPADVYPAYDDSHDNAAYGASDAGYNQYADQDPGYGYQPRGRGFRRGFGRGGFGRGGFSGRGGMQGFNSSSSQGMQAQNGAGMDAITLVAPAVPEGAPTGPKAWREGQVGAVRGGFAPHGGRAGFPTDTAEANRVTSAATPSDRHRSCSPSMDRSPSRSRSASRSRSQHRHRRHRHRSRSSSEDAKEYEQRRSRKKRSSRKYDDDDAAEVRSVDGTGAERLRDDSVDSSDHRSSRREKEKHRSSRSHRDRSRGHRRKRHRSMSPEDDLNVEDESASQVNGTGPGSESSRKKSKSERSERKREKDRERDRTKDRKREKERDRDRGRDRSREQTRKRSKRDRSASQEAHSGEEHGHNRSSHRSRKEKERDRYREREDEYERERNQEQEKRRQKNREREREIEHWESGAAAPAPPSAPAADVEFKIQGRSKDRDRKMSIPTGPAALHPPSGPRSSIAIRPPTGPAAQRRPSGHSVDLLTPGSPQAAIDPHTLEREARNRERMLREQQRRISLQTEQDSTLGRKRSYDDGNGFADERPFAPPTGPSAERNGRKRHRGGKDSSGYAEQGGAKAGKRERRLNYKYEDEENDEARAQRVENEREAARYR